MSHRYQRLTQPLVRDGAHGALRPATWDEALDRAAADLRRLVDRHGPQHVRALQLLEEHERDELHRPEVRARRHRQQQHRQLQPHVTRPQRRRSGDGIRGGRGHELLSGDRGDGPDPAVGVECAGDASDLLPPSAARASATARGCIAVDPRRTSSAQWADVWAGARRRLRHRPGQCRWRREIIAAGLAASRVHRQRDHAASRRIAPSVEPCTLEYAERETGVPAELIREMAHAYARAGRAMICWTLGITEHHNAVDNVLALINLVPADRPRGPLRLGAQSAARAEQRAGRRRHGRACPIGCPGSSTSRTTPCGRSSTGAWGVHDPAEARLAPVADVRGDGARRSPCALRHRREPAAVRGRPAITLGTCSRGSTAWSCRTCS